MRIRPNEREQIAEICREEMDEATRRIAERLSKFQNTMPLDSGARYAGARRFYEDLADKPWTEADEACLKTLGEASDADVKQMLRDGFRRARLSPVPNFAYVIGLAGKPAAEEPAAAPAPLTNPDAVSAVERERLANLLANELTGAAMIIVHRLQLEDARAVTVRELLEEVQMNIVGRYTPLV